MTNVRQYAKRVVRAGNVAELNSWADVRALYRAARSSAIKYRTPDSIPSVQS